MACARQVDEEGLPKRKLLKQLEVVRGAFAETLLVCALLVPSHAIRSESVVVRFPEGVVHGFLSLHALDGSPLADGELIQSRKGDRVTSRLVFHFKDGSLHDETVVYSQRERFRMLHDHLVQRGPAFQRAIETDIDGKSGEIKVRYSDEDGKEKLIAERLDLPVDVSNGMILTLMKNIAPGAPPTTVSIVAATPKPRLIKLLITPAGEEPFSTGGVERKAMHYVIKVEIGGVAGVMAPLIGKQPPDSNVWVFVGETPAFVKAESPLSMGGDPWRIELESPIWPKARASTPAGRSSDPVLPSRTPSP